MNTKSLDTECFLKCIAHVFENVEREDKKPGSEHWTTHSESRRWLFEEVRQLFCTRKGVNLWEFPYSEDAVVLYWFRYRKVPQTERPRRDDWKDFKRALEPEPREKLSPDDGAEE